MVKMNIPATNEVNRPGQKSPPYPLTVKRVASMNNQVIGTPNNISHNLCVLAHGHIIGPFTCIHTIICPSKNIEKDSATCL